MRVAIILFLFSSLVSISCSKYETITQPNSFGRGSQVVTDVGNGGYGVVCVKKEKEEVFFYDYYEADKIGDSIKFDNKLPKGIPNRQMPEFIVESILDRFSMLDPVRAKFLENEYYSSFKWGLSVFYTDAMKPNSFLPTSDLKSLEDLEEGCHLRQIIVQHRKDFKTQYYIDKKLFNQMSALNKAVAIVHELVYQWFLSLGYSEGEDSQVVREMTRFLFNAFDDHGVLDNGMFDLSEGLLRKYVHIVQKTGVVKEISTYLESYDELFGDTGNFQIVVFKLQSDRGEKFDIKFCDGGALKKAYIEGYQIPLFYEESFYDFVINKGEVEFTCDGGLKSFSLGAYESPLKLIINGSRHFCSKKIFIENGQVEYCE